jgi:hypothetical protein
MLYQHRSVETGYMESYAFKFFSTLRNSPTSAAIVRHGGVLLRSVASEGYPVSFVLVTFRRCHYLGSRASSCRMIKELDLKAAVA